MVRFAGLTILATTTEHPADSVSVPQTGRHHVLIPAVVTIVKGYLVPVVMLYQVKSYQIALSYSLHLNGSIPGM